MNWREWVRAGAWVLAVALWSMLASADPLRCEPLDSAAPPAVPAAHARGLAWRVRAPNGAQSTLFGTMHSGDPRVLAERARIAPAFAAADTFVLEVALDGDALGELGQAMFYAGSESLADAVDGALFAATLRLLSMHGIDAAAAARMKPWAALTALSVPPAGPAPPLDLVLLADARAAGKRVLGLESVAEHIAVFEQFSVAVQGDMLREIVCHYAVMQREVDAMIEVYAAHDLAALFARGLRHAGSDRQAFIDALLWQRNARMFERLLPVLESGRAFIAVGALHLPGERGLLGLLAQRGYALEALY